MTWHVPFVNLTRAEFKHLSFEDRFRKVIDIHISDGASGELLGVISEGMAYEYLYLKLGRPSFYVPQHLCDLFLRSRYNVLIGSLRLPYDCFMLVFPTSCVLKSGKKLNQILVCWARSKMSLDMIRSFGMVGNDYQRVDCSTFGNRPGIVIYPRVEGRCVGTHYLPAGAMSCNRAPWGDDGIPKNYKVAVDITSEEQDQIVDLAVAALCRYTTRSETVRKYTLPRSERYSHKGDSDKKRIYTFMDPKIVITGKIPRQADEEPAYTVRPHVRGFVYATLRHPRWYVRNPLKPGELERIQEREPTIIHPEAFEEEMRRQISEDDFK
jgi:hypothetical protein